MEQVFLHYDGIMVKHRCLFQKFRLFACFFSLTVYRCLGQHQQHALNPTRNHDGPQSLPLCLSLFSLLSSSFEFVTSDISHYLSQYREIKFDICSFYQL